MTHDSALEAERSLLAAMLLGPEAVERARRCSLDPAAFGLVAHGKVYAAIMMLGSRGEPVDIVTVAAELRRAGNLEACGGPSALAGILESAGTCENVEAYVRIIRDARRHREAGRLARNIAQRIEAGSGAEEVSALASKLDQLCSGSGDAVRVNRMSDVKPEPVRWLWPGRIPLGMVTVLDGDPGLGKSTVTLDLAARLSRGRAMPDGAPGLGAAGVVILSAEDDAARVIRPRLDAAGADEGRVATVQLADAESGLRDLEISRGDLAALERAVREVGALLVIVDPLMAFLPSEVNAHRDQDVRRALAALRAFSERTGPAVVVIRHLNKRDGGNPLYRGGGSIGIIGAARAGLLLATDPDDSSGEALILAPTKANICRKPPALRLRLVSDGGAAARVQWEGESAHTAGTLLATPTDPEERSALDEAEQFLRELLADGARVQARDGEAEARRRDIARETLRRARRRLGVKSFKVGRPGDEEQHWCWQLPGSSPKEGQRENPEGGHTRDVDPLRPSRDGKPLCERADAGEGHAPAFDPLREGTLTPFGNPAKQPAPSTKLDGGGQLTDLGRFGWEPVGARAARETRAPDPPPPVREPAPELPLGGAT